ncbi:hexose kinase [Micromonospora sp. NPDC047074]|uniref:1-phosphofructokinase family hexose kinase n=1 Tax=Micromonospora sp. NPDC047074 TaxID=3154339 RepID=UPI0034037EEB
MIITVTLNAALDITYEVADLALWGSHRVSAVRQRAGGKGVNVASVLSTFGIAVTATGLVGGGTGAAIRADLDARGVRHAFGDCAGESRRTVNVVSTASGDATIFNEPGPVVTAGEWRSFTSWLDGLVRESGADVVVASGSLPPGAPVDAYAQIVELVRARNARCVVDADGEPLRRALAAGPDVVKPNLAELRAVTGVAAPLRGAAVLRRLGARDVVVSLGADGVLVVPADGPAYRAAAGQRLAGNPTGAGDAAVAAIAAGLARGHDWPRVMGEVVGWSAAAVLSRVAGEVRPVEAARLAAMVRIEETDDAGKA